jgi:nitrite reductase (NADH) small subunit
MPQPEFLTVAKLGDIPLGEGRAFEYNDQVVAVFNDGGQYRAIDDMCPHMGASLAAGHLEDCIVTCPWHSWSFDTRDGAWCDNRRIKIDVYEVRIVGDEIQVAAVRDTPTVVVENRGEPDADGQEPAKTNAPSPNGGPTDQAEQKND